MTSGIWWYIQDFAWFLSLVAASWGLVRPSSLVVEVRPPSQRLASSCFFSHWHEPGVSMHSSIINAAPVAQNLSFCV